MSEPNSLDDLTVGELVARKRATGYDADFEAATAERWLCPHCGHQATILTLAVDPASLEPYCPACDRPGIEPAETGAKLSIIEGGRP